MPKSTPSIQDKVRKPSNMPQYLFDGPDESESMFLFAHGSGVGMDSEFMSSMVLGLGERGIKVMRFEFAYMAARRTGGAKRPPPRAPVLEAEFVDAIDALKPGGSIFIGGKSMGGRIASMVANALFAQNKIAGLICLGYPFHPTGKPEKLRVDHLKDLTLPTLICQGTRDPFGTAQEVATYGLPDKITQEWLEDGDHGFKPRKASGLTLEQNMDQAINATARFIAANS
jgi:predicted alpha/beta-hydrolase family hydrolase